MRLVARALSVLFGVIVLGFVLTRVLPGDPVAVLGATPGMTDAELNALRLTLGLDPVAKRIDSREAAALGAIGRRLAHGVGERDALDRAELLGVLAVLIIATRKDGDQQLHF